MASKAKDAKNEQQEERRDPVRPEEGSIPGVGKRTEEVAVEGKGDVDDEREYSNEEINEMATPEALRASGARVGDPTEGPSS